jgi:hypothetical protein
MLHDAYNEGMSDSLNAVDDDVAKLESATRVDCRAAGMTEAQVSIAVNIARGAYLAGWSRGHDSASAKALQVMQDERERRNQGVWPSEPARAGKR